jgi:16S rRNA (uracil1498-N3)-methyltransferase
VPVIEEPVSLERLLADGALGTILFADEAGDAVPVAEALAGAPASVTLLVGPEGGFHACRADPFCAAQPK